ncbi:MAG: 7-cyano-7-deazaguanine synthase, partial [Planctomycetaceae bacterium]
AEGIPVTYVPARNTIFLALALGWAEALGSTDLFIGVNAVDYSGYPDCRPEFISAFGGLANLATQVAVEGRGRFEVHAPLISMTKAEIIRTGMALGIDYGLTSSCYDPDASGRPCARCDSCRLRIKGFAEAEAVDPLEYRQS